MEGWQRVWREGLAPVLSTTGLRALERGLRDDDPCLVQGMKTSPPPLRELHDWPVEAGCAVCYCGWKGDGLESVAEVDEFFERVCAEADRRLGAPGASNQFFEWFDTIPRKEMRPLMLEQVEHALARREAAGAAEQVPAA